jgi:hypothetical protein
VQLCVGSAYNVSISLKIVSYRAVNYLDVKLAAFVRMRLSFAGGGGVSSWHFLGFISAVHLMKLILTRTAVPEVCFAVSKVSVTSS